MTLGAWLEAWLQEECGPNLAVNTVKQYASLIKNHIVPTIGSVPLAKLKTHSLQAFLNKLTKTARKDGKPGFLSPTTIGLVHAVLGSSLSRAVEFNLLPTSPMKNVRPPRKDSREVTPMEPDEALKFVLAAQECSPYYALYWECLSCGLRIGEALGLRWTDVDLDARTISVRYTLLRGKGSLKERLSQPKTKKSVRTVPLSPAPLEALRQHRKRQIQARLQAGPFWQDHDLVFPTSKGTPLNDSNVRNRDLKRVLDRAELGHYRLHDFRHTSATMALLAGVPAKVVQERLGHSRISTTMDIYRHVTQDLQRSASDLIERAILGQSAPSQGL